MNRQLVTDMVPQHRVKKYDTVKRPTSQAVFRSSRVSPSRPLAHKPKSQQTNKISAKQRISSVNDSQQETKQQTIQRNVSTKQQSQNARLKTMLLALRSVSRTPALASASASDQFILESSSIRSESRHTKTQTIVYVVATMIFLFSASASIYSFSVNRYAQEKLGVLGDNTNIRTDETGVAEGTGDSPAEGPVSGESIAKYTVAPDMPRYIRIPKLNTFARIKHSGETPQGAVDAPWNIHDSGWYKGSAKPGSSRGSSLLLGHVSGWTADGVFKQLHKLGAGDTFEVELGSGEKITYEVTRSESLAVEDINMAKVLSEDVSGLHDIKLMTCSGRYDRESDSYAERRIVYAKPI